VLHDDVVERAGVWLSLVDYAAGLDELRDFRIDQASSYLGADMSATRHLQIEVETVLRLLGLGNSEEGDRRLRTRRVGDGGAVIPFVLGYVLCDQARLPGLPPCRRGRFDVAERDRPEPGERTWCRAVE